MKWLIIPLLTLFLVGSARWQYETRSDQDIGSIRSLLLEQQTDWNEGDIEAFMEGYWRSDSLTFVSDTSVQRGWETTLDRYRSAYPDTSSMGQLVFDLYQIRLLSSDRAFVFGRFTLQRERDRPTGLFTLLLRKIDENWKIVFDHTST